MGISDVAKPADLNIPKLTVTNYKIWRELVTEALEGRGIWEYVEGDVAKPDEDGKNKEQLRKWRRNNAVAVGIIKGNLSDSQLGHVMGMRDAKEVWDTLKEIHQTTDDARVQSLIAEFIQFRMITTIDEGASTLTRLQNEIGILDSESRPSDALKVQTLLAGLGPEYEATLAALQASKTKKFEEVVAQLRMAQTRLKGQISLHPDQALFSSAKGRSGTKKKNNSDKENDAGAKKRKCFHCGSTDHLIKECEDFLDEIRQQVKDDMAGSKGSHGKHHTALAMTAGQPREGEEVIPW